ncbi:MAG: DUF6794 domain-containing protein [Saprospiraceae bacterium]
MMNLKKLIFCIAFFGVIGATMAQTADSYEAEYARRIKLESINGVYIPTDLYDAFAEITRLSNAADLEKFKNAPDSVIYKSHFGLKKWIQLNWGLDDGSRISDYLKQRGISVPDDMANILVLMFHRQLNNQPLNLEEETGKITRRMEQEKMKRDSMKVIISVEKRPHKG